MALPDAVFAHVVQMCSCSWQLLLMFNLELQQLQQ